MARDHARIRLDIWDDEDFCNLTTTAQWLYFRVLSHASLSYCGVADWRPGRLAASANDATASDIEAFAIELERGNYFVVDRDTEEVLVRSFVKHDELMGKWNMASAVARTWSEVASKPLKGVVVHELHRLMGAGADGKWDRDDVQKVLKRRRLTPSEAREMTLPNPTGCTTHWPSECPNDCPSERGKESPSDWGDDAPRNGAGNGGALLPTPFSPLPSPESLPSSSLPIGHQEDGPDGEGMMTASRQRSAS